MKQLTLLNPEKSSESEVTTYGTREAVRAVVIDDQNHVALLHVANEQYYKIPGGGIEGNENHELALQRESLEEIGSEVEVIGEIGSIVEWRKFCKLKQTSYCYFAKLRGEKGKPHFTEKELSQGFEQIWLPYEEALEVISNNSATTIEGKQYIVPRDIIFLEAARELVTSQ